jgi:prevent-host-death family protein
MYNLCSFEPGHTMKTIAASDARQSFASVIDAAAREPIVIRRQQRDVAVLLSMQEYERLTQLNRAEFQRFCDAVGQRAAAAGMTDRALNDLLGEDSDA